MTGERTMNTKKTVFLNPFALCADLILFGSFDSHFRAVEEKSLLLKHQKNVATCLGMKKNLNFREGVKLV
jgi:hypothetical protein